ncbi:MAG TPA: hypothetical protein VGB71_01560 [Flavisolibacter sp.]|jgi:hypothetical protein
MYELFELPVIYKGEEQLFPTQLVQAGYVHQFKVDVYGEEVSFEQDEEGSYRAIVSPQQLSKQLSPELLQAIAESIEAIVG